MATGEGKVSDQQFESTGVITGISKGKFAQSFVAEVDNGDKLYGSKVKQDGSPAKVWPLIQRSFNDVIPFKWTGNLKAGENGHFRQVTFGFAVEAPSGNGEFWRNPSAAELAKDQKVGPIETVEDLSSDEVANDDIWAGTSESAETETKPVPKQKKDNITASVAASYAKDFVLGCIQMSMSAEDTKAWWITWREMAENVKIWLDQQ
jgi:hypothetical protein